MAIVYLLLVHKLNQLHLILLDDQLCSAQKLYGKYFSVLVEH